MTESGGTYIRCPDCDAGYRWRPKLAGRRVRCACGAILRMPMDPGDKPGLIVAAAEVGSRASIGGVVPLGEPDEPSAFREAPHPLPPLIDPGDWPSGPPGDPRIERSIAEEIYETAMPVEVEPEAAAPPRAAPLPASRPDLPQLDLDAPPLPDDLHGQLTVDSDGTPTWTDRLEAFEGDSNAPSEPPRAARCPNCGLSLRPGQVLCLNCGFHVQSGTRVRTRVVAPPDDAATARAGGPVSSPAGGAAQEASDAADLDAAQVAAVRAAAPALSASRAAILARGGAVHGGGATLHVEDEDALSRRGRFIDFYLPLILIGVGAAVVLLQALVSTPSPSYRLEIGGLVLNQQPLQSTAIEMMVAIPFLLVGLIVAARTLDLEFGTLGTALLKVTAIVMFVNTITQTGVWMMGLAGSLLGLIFLLPSYWVLVAVLFGLEASEAWKVVLILLAARIILFCAGVLGLATLFA